MHDIVIRGGTIIDAPGFTGDVAAQVPHHPLRVFVMGERGINREAATPEDIDEICRLTETAVRSGS